MNWDMDELISSELVGLEKDKVSSEVTIRILEARVKSLLSQLQAVNLKSSEKDVKMTALENKLKEQSQDRLQMLKQLGSKETQMNKLQTSVKTMQSRLQHLERVEFDLRKELNSLKQSHQQKETTNKSLEGKLLETQNELKKCREIVKLAKKESQDNLEQERRKSSQLSREKQQLEKLKGELVQYIKKQMQLIDVLKKQKLHLEAAKTLEFSAEEWRRITNPEAPSFVFTS